MHRGPSGESGHPRSRLANLRKATLQRRWRLVFLVALLSIVGFVGWSIYSAVVVKNNLEAVAVHFDKIEASLKSGDFASIEDEGSAARASAARAAEASRSLPWQIVGKVPVVGRPVESLSQIAALAQRVTDDVVPPVMSALRQLDFANIHTEDGIELAPIESAVPSLAAALDEAHAAALSASQIESGGYLSPVTSARDRLRHAVEDLAQGLESTYTAAKLAPEMLGKNGARSYIIAFQTNAETRGTGGLVGGIGIIRSSNGTITVDNIASNVALRNDLRPMDLGPDFENLYGAYEPTRIWENSNISPHFPYAGAFWRDLWHQQTGELVDGAVAVDPVALSYMLSATGPITMDDGEVIDAGNVVALTESTAYARFSGDVLGRKKYLVDVAEKVVVKLVASTNSSGIVSALKRGVAERRIALWSAHPNEQARLESTEIGHAVPYTPAPYAAVVINNAGASKLDYYIEKSITYDGETCWAATRRTEVSAAITNTVPAVPLPDYVLGPDTSLPPGTNKMIVSLYATSGATLVQVTDNGRPLPVASGTERGHPTYSVLLDVAPRGTSVVRFVLDEPTVVGTPVAPLQPAVAASSSAVELPSCPGGG